MNRYLTNPGNSFRAVFQRIYNRSFGEKSLRTIEETHTLHSGALAFPNHPIEISSTKIQFMGFKKDIVPKRVPTILETITEIEPFNPELVRLEFCNINKIQFTFRTNYRRDAFSFASQSLLYIDTKIYVHLQNNTRYQVIGEWIDSANIQNLEAFIRKNIPESITLEGLDKAANILTLLEENKKEFTTSMLIGLTLAAVLTIIIMLDII